MKLLNREFAEVSIIQIRYITPADDRMAISKIYEESWKYAYKGVIPQNILIQFQRGVGWQIWIS